MPAEARLSLLVALEDRPGALEQALSAFTAAGVNLTHIESRPALGASFDFFVDCEGDRDDPAVKAAITALEPLAEKLLILDRQEVPWFPRHISELDLLASHTLDAGAELTADHPGFKDTDYRQSRARIDALARAYHHGAPLPEPDYSMEETATWQTVYTKLRKLHAAHACNAYERAIAELEAEAGFGAAQIPQFTAVSDFLKERTGFRLRPVSGLLGPREFLAGLAFRVFFATQYVRHHSRPLYTPEPDVCHELIGHAPMFADAAFADFSQEIGLASLGASDQDIEALSRCYWYSVEFGLLREGEGLKAYGAGLLSSFGELEYACGRGKDGRLPDYLAWDPAAAADRPYAITEYQSGYFVAPSLQQAKRRMRSFCRDLPRPFYARYNDTTERIWVDRAVRRQQLD
ncbi:MAG: ACT domain-containing protein [Pseudomonadota bacterium]